jgi:outer membrane murein-binding lipoprotein Lpp
MAWLSPADGSSDRDEIVQLEAQIDELAAKIENCRKFILAGRIAVVLGGAVLVAMLLGMLRSDPSVMGLAAAAVLGGIVVAGSNRSTAKEASNELSANEAKLAHLIDQLELQTVSGRQVLHSQD